MFPIGRDYDRRTFDGKPVGRILPSATLDWERALLSDHAILMPIGCNSLRTILFNSWFQLISLLPFEPCCRREAVIKGLRRKRLSETMTRDKHRLMAFLCTNVVMLLLVKQNLAAQAVAKEVPATQLAELSRSIEDLSDRVSPAVVQVFASGFRVNPETGSSDAGLISKTRNVGSGVVMDAEGHVLTNAHVIAGAAAVEVALPALFEVNCLIPGGQTNLAPPPPPPPPPPPLKKNKTKWNTKVRIAVTAPGGALVVTRADVSQVHIQVLILVLGPPADWKLRIQLRKRSRWSSGAVGFGC